MSFGERLRLLRKEKGVTQKNLGKVMGITDQAISHYEKGKRFPDTKMIRKLADYFNVSTDYLLGNSYEKITVEGLKEELAADPEFKNFMDKISERDDLQELFKETKDLTPDEVKQLIRVIKALHTR